MISKNTKNNVIKTAVVFSAAVTASILGNAQETKSVYADTVYSTTDYLNLRKGPSTDKERITVIPAKEQVVVKEFVNKGEWAEVTWKGYKGYVSSSYLVKESSSTKTPINTTNDITDHSLSLRKDGYHMYVTQGTSLMEDANEKSNVVSNLMQYDDVLILNKKNGYYMVRSNGKLGYIKTSLVSDYGTVKKSETPINPPSTNPIKDDKSKDNNKEVVKDNTASSKIMATTAYVNFREGASLKSNIIMVVPTGHEVKLINNSGAFYKVNYQGTSGYMSKDFLKEVSKPTNEKPEPKKPTPPAPSRPIEKEKMVTTVYLNLRSGQSTSSSLITTVSSGTTVEVLEKNSNGWFKVNVNNQMGYMYSQYLAPIKGEVKPDNPIKNVKTAVLKEDAYFKVGPNNDFKNIGYLTKGTEVTVLDDSGYFVKVYYGGKTGYILNIYLDMGKKSSNPAPNKPISENILKSAFTTEYLNLRVSASVKSDKLTVIPKGSKVDVFSENNGWSKVIYNSQKGYVYSTYLQDEKTGKEKEKPTNPTIPTAPGELSKIKISGRVFNMYSSSLQITGRESVSNQIKVVGLKNTYSNTDIALTGSTSISNAKEVYVYVNGFLQGKAVFDGKNFSYRIKNNVTKPNTNTITVKVETSSGKEYVSSYTVKINKTPVVVIDPGHGGVQPGAVGVGPDGRKHKESDYTLMISKKLKSELEDRGFKVVLTRNGDYDVSLTERANIANRINADFFISVHHNAARSSSVNGSWTGYPGKKLNPVSQGAFTESALISELLEIAYSNAGLRKIEACTDSDYTGYNYAVNKVANMKSVLTEVGFISGSDDIKKIISPTFHTKVAQEMARALHTYFFSQN